MNDLIRTIGLGKNYLLPDKEVLRVFTDLNFSMETGETVAVMGSSGAGKTTFLNLLGALDRPTSGTVVLDGQDLYALDIVARARVRNSKIGFVFQFFHLLPEFTALENVMLPLWMGGLERSAAAALGEEMLGEVGLGHKAKCRPAMLSGGEMQRVAIARALVTRPKILLADEPTGNLDWKTGESVLRLLLDLHEKHGLASILVTHNDKVSAFCRKTYILECGEMKRLA